MRFGAGLLAKLVHDKTAGNPFFVIEFLRAAAEEGLLRFDHDAARAGPGISTGFPPRITPTMSST
jgi:predicted ATPase